jgi:hypothetical protein
MDSNQTDLIVVGSDQTDLIVVDSDQSDLFDVNFNDRHHNKKSGTGHISFMGENYLFFFKKKIRRKHEVITFFVTFESERETKKKLKLNFRTPHNVKTKTQNSTGIDTRVETRYFKIGVIETKFFGDGKIIPLDKNTYTHPLNLKTDRYPFELLMNTLLEKVTRSYSDNIGKNMNDCIRQISFAKIVEIIEKIDSKLTVVEVGSGNGYLLKSLRRFFPGRKFIGVEPYPGEFNGSVNGCKPDYAYVKDLIKVRKDLIGKCVLILDWPYHDGYGLAKKESDEKRKFPLVNYDYQAVKSLDPVDIIYSFEPYHGRGLGGGGVMIDLVKNSGAIFLDKKGVYSRGEPAKKIIQEHESERKLLLNNFHKIKECDCCKIKESLRCFNGDSYEDQVYGNYLSNLDYECFYSNIDKFIEFSNKLQQYFEFDLKPLIKKYERTKNIKMCTCCLLRKNWFVHKANIEDICCTENERELGTKLRRLLPKLKCFVNDLDINTFLKLFNIEVDLFREDELQNYHKDDPWIDKFHDVIRTFEKELKTVSFRGDFESEIKLIDHARKYSLHFETNGSNNLPKMYLLLLMLTQVKIDVEKIKYIEPSLFPKYYPVNTTIKEILMEDMDEIVSDVSIAVYHLVHISKRKCDEHQKVVLPCDYHSSSCL